MPSLRLLCQVCVYCVISERITDFLVLSNPKCKEDCKIEEYSYSYISLYSHTKNHFVVSKSDLLCGKKQYRTGFYQHDIDVYSWLILDVVL